MQNKLTVSIGIPAYNEEQNIKYLLERILEQTQGNWELKEVIVVSDGSTDSTVSLVRSIADSRILVVDHIDRKGAALRQNEIVEKSQGDIIVLLNADVLPKNNNFISCLVRPFTQQTNVGIVGNKGTPLPAQTFIERIINYSVIIKTEAAQRWNGGDNLYLCHGHSRAFSKSFAKNFKWPALAAEDAYSYLECKKQNFLFVYEPKAEIVFRSPQNINDHLKQSIRFFQAQKQLFQYLSEGDVKKAHAMPLGVTAPVIVKYLFKNPFLFFCYGLLLLYSKFSTRFRKLSFAVWDMSASSKKL